MSDHRANYFCVYCNSRLKNLSGEYISMSTLVSFCRPMAVSEMKEEVRKITLALMNDAGISTQELSSTGWFPLSQTEKESH